MEHTARPSAFELRDVVKRFGRVTALDGVTLSAPGGQVFGLLGPNGAGKTTIVKILSTLLRPDSGVARVAGLDVAEHPDQVRRLIGMAGQYAAVDEFQTGYENVMMIGELYGLSRKESRARTHELLERLDLVDAGSHPVSTYSGGMRRRLDLGASLVGRPSILFLDEPTTGLDPKARNDAWDIVRELVEDGTSILLTTQYLEEADELADVIAIVDRGRLIASGTSEELKSRLGGDIVEFQLARTSDHERARAAVSGLARDTPTYDPTAGTMTVPVSRGAHDLMSVVQALNDHHVEVKELSLHRPSLDDVFLSLTGVSRGAR